MAAKMNFTSGDIRRQFEQAGQKIENIIILNLKYLAEECVNIARLSGSYKNQTGNLRNSIGYVILRNGQVISENFEQTASGGAEGVAQGRKSAYDLISQYPSGYVLIILAGMPYAHVLEARSIDVLTSAEQYAEKELPELKRQILADFKRAKL